MGLELCTPGLRGHLVVLQPLGIQLPQGIKLSMYTFLAVFKVAFDANARHGNIGSKLNQDAS